MKRTLYLFFCLFVIIFLAGCVAGSPEEQEKEEYVVTVWTKDRHDMQFQQQKIQEYNEENKGHIRVEYKVFGDNYAQAVNNALMNQNAPDLMVYTSQILYEHINDGSYADLMPFMKEEFKDIFGKLILENVNVFDGKCYFIPTAASPCRLFYNKTLFSRAGIDRAPATMEEMIEDARLITQQFSEEGIYGFAINMKNAPSALNRSFVKQMNLDMGLKAGYDFAEGRYDFVRCEKLVEAWRELLSLDCAYPDCRNLDIDPLRQLFADGRIGMYISYVHSERGAYAEQFPMEDTWGCVEIPSLDGTLHGVQNYSMNNGYLLNAHCENPEIVWQVYCELFANVDNLTEYYMSGYGISIVPEVLERAKQNGYEIAEPACAVGENDGIWPLAPHERTTGALKLAGLDLYDTIKELMLGNGDIQAELTALTERYNRAYEEGVRSGAGMEIKIEQFDPLHPSEEHRALEVSYFLDAAKYIKTSNGLVAYENKRRLP